MEFFADTCVGRRRLQAAGVALLAALLVSGCETSSSVSTGPNPVKCVVSLEVRPRWTPAAAAVVWNITTQPECAWDVSTNVS